MSMLFSREDHLRLASIIREETGNNVQEKNLSMIESRLKSRMMKLGLESLPAYWDYFSSHESEERQVLQGLMTTHYTYFFREYSHFEAMEAWIDGNAERLKSSFLASRQPFKVWSAACSRGQEVYSLAMFLDAHLTKKYGVTFNILGTDIDPESVKYAQNGVYPLKEVNTIPQQYLSGYWRRGTGTIKEFAAFHPRLRECIRFSTLNLFDLQRGAVPEIFDIILARNVFIYFSEPDVQTIAKELEKRLANDALFISGVSEALRFDGWTLPSIATTVYEKSNQPKQVQNNQGKPIIDSVLKVDDTYEVLCVDDSPTILALLKKIFSQDKLCKSVSTAANGVEARNALDHKKFDLITLDIHMPVMGGIEFLEREYKKDRDPPVIIVSSVNRQDADLATKAINLGAFDYVEKPAMNNLQHSTLEILNKVKFAVKSGRSAGSTGLETLGSKKVNFNHEISRKIVVPDASRCVRFLVGDTGSIELFQAAMSGLAHEQRSPAVVISGLTPEVDAVFKKIKSMTHLPIIEIKEEIRVLKPNHVYLAINSQNPKIQELTANKVVSLQIVGSKPRPLDFKWKVAPQVLIDESVENLWETELRKSSLRVSDVTPATSFASLSLEYFANLRKSEVA